MHCSCIMSLPLRECGLKYPFHGHRRYPLESLPLRECGLKSHVILDHSKHFLSLPLRECGLKYLRWLWCLPRIRVTPLAGVWIEIKRRNLRCQIRHGHSPCGSVD